MQLPGRSFRSRSVTGSPGLGDGGAGDTNPRCRRTLPLCLAVVIEPGPVGQLAFQGGEEALGHGVVVAVPDRAHRRRHAPLPAALAEGQRGGLAALVGVVDDRSATSLSERHIQRVEDQLGAQGMSHRPAHHPAAEHVEHDGQGHESCGARDVGDIGHPPPVRRISLEATLDQVRRRAGLGGTTRGARPLPTTSPGQACLTHHPSHPLAAHRHALSGPLRVNPRCAPYKVPPLRW